jgi:hypothetical protein
MPNFVETSSEMIDPWGLLQATAFIFAVELAEQYVMPTSLLRIAAAQSYF